MRRQALLWTRIQQSSTKYCKKVHKKRTFFAFPFIILLRAPKTLKQFCQMNSIRTFPDGFEVTQGRLICLYYVSTLNLNFAKQSNTKCFLLLPRMKQSYLMPDVQPVQFLLRSCTYPNRARNSKNWYSSSRNYITIPKKHILRRLDGYRSNRPDIR